MFYDVKTYAPDEVFLTFGGATVEGWESITVRRSSSEFKTVKGIRGKNTRISDPNTHSTIEIACHQTSMTNQILTRVVELDVNTQGVRLEVSLKDSSGWEVFSSEEAYVLRSADRGYRVDMGTRLWTIECLNSRWGDEGGEGLLSSIFDSVSSIF